MTTTAEPSTLPPEHAASRTAPIDAPVLDLIAERWSPRSFDADHELSEDDLTTLLEAARWAPSASNTQPWTFVVGLRGSGTHARIAAHLMGFNAVWAGNASALVAIATRVVDADGKPLRWSRYDAGQAGAHLALQAQALGLHTHAMGGIAWEALREEFGLGADHDVQTVIAVGRLAAADLLPDTLREREQLPRTRKPLSELVIR